MAKPKSEKHKAVHAALTKAGRPDHVARKVADSACKGKKSR